jgi:streptogramin lyase
VLNVPDSHYPYAIASEDLGGRIPFYKAPDSTSSIAILSDRAVFAAEDDAAKMVRISPSGQVSQVPLPSPGNGASVVAGPAGNALADRASATEHQRSRHIVRVTPSGAATAFSIPQEQPPGESFTVPTPLTALAAGRGKILWFTTDEGVGTITTAGVVTHLITFSFPTQPNDLATASDGSVWVTDGDAQLDRVSPNGMVTSVALPPGSTGDSIARGPGGDMYFLAEEQSGVWQVSATGTPRFIPLRVRDNTEGAKPNSYFWGPATSNGLAQGPDGTLWAVGEITGNSGGSNDQPVVINLAGKCIVPQVTGGLSDAKAVLSDHQCRLGRVSVIGPNDVPRSDMAIACQSRAAGRVLAAGTEVSLRLYDALDIRKPRC